MHGDGERETHGDLGHLGRGGGHGGHGGHGEQGDGDRDLHTVTHVVLHGGDVVTHVVMHVDGDDGRDRMIRA